MTFMQRLRKLFSAQDLTVGSPLKGLLLFSMPLLLGNLTQQMYNTVDAALLLFSGVYEYVSKSGDEAFIAEAWPVLERSVEVSMEEENRDKALLTVEKIVEFADSVDISDVEELIQRQIDYNMAIAKEGLEKNYGAQVGKTLLSTVKVRTIDTVRTIAKAYAAAGSDARMSGCELAVISLSGSGTQGITASVPVAVYARAFGASEDLLLRAVAVSDLITVHQKTGIGRLSAYCGAISAGVGAGAGIAYLHGGRYEAVAHTVVNAIAILSGTICDGAKPSCAAKIAAAVDAGILGWQMHEENQQFYSGDGIVTKGVDRTVKNVGRLASEGMRQTDETILQIMLDEG